ncbi:MarR family winged helix-turn-helix transcriptional regulator [Pseudomonas vanderleydeniana]|uniref:MarR family winged helix-turn-helix transcriptional regulator n=1 Tax=Pseudomonas vanderleydeniana TaxID=2745495 RepID=A0A9E6TPX2_9PSED|nr:MarR family winged helix-turn-helix transcriptional regulator [Pseudomonas vanderleydeniana]QXI26294.1 MarR family winged helix-turn-helix transcriptional regulator [Pseudomonas vanderleydeniana]
MTIDLKCYSFLMRAATRRIVSTYDSALCHLGINVEQYSLLVLIQRSGRVSLTELARLAHLQRSTVSRNVRVLEGKKVVSTGRGGSDSREILVALTEAGILVVAEAAPIWQRCQSEVESQVGSSEMEILKRILKKI